MNKLTKPMSVLLALSLLCGICVVSTSAAFTDVPSGAWYELAVGWCSYYGIISGISDGP